MSHRTRPRRRYDREERRARGNRVGYLIFALVLVVLVASGYFLLEHKRQFRLLDAESSCPLEPKGTEGVTALLVDMTDAMTPAQKKDLQNELESLRATIPRYGRLEIYTVNPTAESLLKPIVSLCNPGRGKDIDPLVGNPEHVEERWRTGFEAPVNKAFEVILDSAGAINSPILESIQSVTLTSFRQVDRAGRPHKLIIASDLLQFARGISFYKGLPDVNTLLVMPSFQSARADLRGVDVELWMLFRPEMAHLQTRTLANLWAALLSAQGARVTRVYNVHG